MNSISERIAQCIDSSRLTKTAFAQRIGLTQAYISALSIGRKVPSDRTIADICREFNVNEKWLRTGEGEMFRKPPGTLADRLSKEYGLDELGRQIMAAYLKLDENDRLSVGRLIQNLLDEREMEPAPAAISKTETTTPAPPAGTDTPVPTDYETEARAEAEEYYREILEEKRRAAGGSASSASSETKPA